MTVPLSANTQVCPQYKTGPSTGCLSAIRAKCVFTPHVMFRYGSGYICQGPLLSLGVCSVTECIGCIVRFSMMLDCHSCKQLAQVRLMLPDFSEYNDTEAHAACIGNKYYSDDWGPPFSAGHSSEAHH